MSSVELRNVWKRYTLDAPPAVRDVSLHINHGEFLVFVGPSGCGKSTTLRMIAGLEDITDGRIAIGDRVINDIAPKDRNIAMVFQNYALYPNMDVFENVAFSLRLQKLQKYFISEKVKETTETLGIGAYQDRLPNQLSGGQRQRVAVGRAMVRNPAAFLMDEPLSNLDAKMRVQMRMELSNLHRELDSTTIYVTHDQIEAMTMGDRIVVMKDGLIQQAGTPEDVYNVPANTFVGGFIGSPPMNFVHGRVVAQEENGTRFFSKGTRLILDELGERDGEAVPANRTVIAGIRPEHMEVGPDGTHPLEDNALRGTVVLQELIGADRLIYVDIQERQPLVVRTAPRNKYSHGDNVRVHVDFDSLHFFDPQSGERVY